MQIVIREKLVDDTENIYVNRDVIDHIQSFVNERTGIHLGEKIILTSLTLAWHYMLPHDRPKNIDKCNHDIVYMALDAICGIYEGSDWT